MNFCLGLLHEMQCSKQASNPVVTAPLHHQVCSNAFLTIHPAMEKLCKR